MLIISPFKKFNFYIYMYNCHNLLFDYLKRVDFISPFQSFRLCCSWLNWKKYLLNKGKEIK